MKTLLIANRGEIACRIVQTARRMGIRSVAVYSDADAHARHVQIADTALRIGPAVATQSYLDIAALIGAARASGADAVHPGYGFLSERAAFAQAVVDAGLTWVGPTPAAIAAMGDKAEAKRLMVAAGVPCVPGWMGDAQDAASLESAAHELGLPLLIKARAGGGGRGMRLVRDWADWPTALAGARREAEAAFGDGALLLERLVEHGRHLEVQVFGDRSGHVVHLGERDCSVQRRRQKIIEESPAPNLPPALRAALCHDAVAAARAVGYVNAGTVEFIVDRDGRHFFLEMNTRLQVEHPVTEAVTGLDLVEWQLRVARGEPLPLAQEQIAFDGHAIELRLNAEDPWDRDNPWAPQTGTVLAFDAAAAGTVRVDHGVVDGQAVTPHYDAMLAKFIAHGPTRDDAIRQLVHALEVAPLFGPVTNAGLLHRLIQHPAFAQAQIDTGTLDTWQAERQESLMDRPVPSAAAWDFAAAWFAAGERAARSAPRLAPSWAQPMLTLHCGTEQRRIAPGPHALPRGMGHAVRTTATGPALQVAHEAVVFEFAPASPWPAAATRVDPSRIVSPVAGTVAQLRVAVGDPVVAGQPLASVEAMKMEMWVSASANGVVRAIHVAPGQGVAAQGAMIDIRTEPEPA